ncbi:chalcone isomerase family protein [Pseudoalteromonas tunicata]|jgi:hypothetical protein|uniref:Chalcone isomerase domain-containing protein n=1 Tax=Pseudoalteromonas tunicata D2 TaxID=87626 RepID=A4C4B3_9GAMM|nr:chalcone isomerase family protein [Pseudoalteromonas tunicata]ATC97123.1 hypothetical protein PTUN_b0786 [Pseudoalteromonas tunicata]AXT33231.1 hypothetical protein D1819_20695 [Pseudoalteromonas tunicata]EAR30395.1 hypothetical protein PTD2_02461 [Pseudoalteromonas tunicata D2]
MIIRISFFFSLFISFNVYSKPIDDLEKIGEGVMSVMFWDVYRAQLYSSKKPYELSIRPQALNIVYFRDIDKKDLIDATEDQWKKIGFSHQNIDKWLVKLETIWPNVTNNSQLTLRVEADKSYFYHNNELIGELNDADFGPAFIAIWLSEKTTRPALRLQLLGLK